MQLTLHGVAGFVFNSANQHLLMDNFQFNIHHKYMYASDASRRCLEPGAQ